MKIALVGSAPASVRLAPYGNPEWHIIGCSPAVYGVAPRINEWFELHLWEPGQPWFSPEYVQWMTALPKRGVKLWVGGPTGIEGAEILPAEAMLQAHDPQRWFCSSSLFWMMARAMDLIAEQCAKDGRMPSPELDKIAFYGVDMAADTEYEMQRAGIHYMAYRAAAAGVEVGAPMESDLFTPRFRYGIDEWTHSFRKVRARREELLSRKAQAEAAAKHAAEGAIFLAGAIEDLKYMGDTWATEKTSVGPAVAQAVPPMTGTNVSIEAVFDEGTKIVKGFVPDDRPPGS